MWGRSEYDAITVRDPRKDEKVYWLYIEKTSSNSLEIEELSDEHEAPNGDNGTAEGESGSERARDEAPREASEVSKVVGSLIRRI